MARNLQAKLPSSDTLRVFDINAESVERFANETKALSSGAAVEVATNSRDAAENSVSISHSNSLLFTQPFFLPLNDEFVPRMI
jgi:3-hydroxyisobutyrate dehydrogenase